MTDNNRLDLDADLNKVTGDLLKDIKAATEQVKQRKASDSEKDKRNAEKSKERNLMMILIAVAVVVLIAIAFIVMNRPAPGKLVPVATPPKARNLKINPPVRTTMPKVPATPSTAPVQTNNRQNQPPPNDYDQPGQ